MLTFPLFRCVHMLKLAWQRVYEDPERVPSICDTWCEEQDGQKDVHISCGVPCAVGVKIWRCSADSRGSGLLCKQFDENYPFYSSTRKVLSDSSELYHKYWEDWYLTFLSSKGVEIQDGHGRAHYHVRGCKGTWREGSNSIKVIFSNCRRRFVMIGVISGGTWIEGLLCHKCLSLVVYGARWFQ